MLDKRREHAYGFECAGCGEEAGTCRYIESRTVDGAFAVCCPCLLKHCRRMPGIVRRYAGVTSERHLIDGYRFCMARGWEKCAQICISHTYMIQDIETSIGTCDVSEEALFAWNGYSQIRPVK